ncbi:putative DD41D transposase [Trichonephila clavipes]|nr:putative DD41D transposase [Trichonephila clavipes]
MVYGDEDDCKSHATQRLYQKRYPNRRVPHHTTFASINRRAVGSLVVRASDSRPEGLGSMPDTTKHPPSTHGFTCRNCGGGDRSRIAIYRPFGEFRRGKIALSPVWCSRPTTGVPLAHATMNFVGLDLTTLDSCQVIYSQFGLAIHQNDHQARRRFFEWVQKIAVVPDFHKRILFSDGAHFWLNGYVNKQNCRISSEANPQVYVETPLHPEKLTVWCALWAGGILLQNDEGHNVTVNGDRYRAMITNFFIPELNNHDVQELWFQQDGATCHTAHATIDLLKDAFGDRLISRFGPVNWPPRSCDLTPLDYFLWGYIKPLVSADKPQTLDHLEDNIRRVIADIRPQMLEKVIGNWTSRLDYIRASRGSHMPEIILKIFNKKESGLDTAVETVTMVSMQIAAKEAKDVSGHSDITVAIDGTWQKHGHTSLNGAVIATRFYTVKVSGAIEISQRLESFHGLRYTKFSGDGDAKAYKAVNEMQSYGNTGIEKVECVGYVKKRMGTRLRALKLKMKGKKLSDKKNIG